MIVIERASSGQCEVRELVCCDCTSEIDVLADARRAGRSAKTPLRQPTGFGDPYAVEIDAPPARKVCSLS
jgi:hypothetical protein